MPQMLLHPAPLTPGGVEKSAAADSPPRIRTSPWRAFAARVYSRLHGSTIAVRGAGNQLSLADSVRRHCRIRVSGNRNDVRLGAGCRLWNLDLEIVGDDHVVSIGASCAIRGGHWLVEDCGSRISIGAGTTLIEDRLIASEGRAIT